MDFKSHLCRGAEEARPTAAAEPHRHDYSYIEAVSDAPSVRSFWAAAFLLAAEATMAIEEPRYTITASYPGFEVRRYDTYVVAETDVDGDFEKAGNEGFRRLARYIFGNNRISARLEMTAPVAQSVKIPMTAPVAQQSREGTYLIQFVMPSDRTIATLPEPLDSRISLREVPAHSVAVRRYSGGWSRSRYEKELRYLRRALRERGLREKAQPSWARYNSPFSLWFLRRNEIQIEVGDTRSGGSSARTGGPAELD
jgi:hypothetical protein